MSLSFALTHASHCRAGPSDSVFLQMPPGSVSSIGAEAHLTGQTKVPARASRPFPRPFFAVPSRST